MDWKVVLAVLCLMGIIALTPVASDSNSTITSNTVNSTNNGNSNSTSTSNSTSSNNSTGSSNNTSTVNGTNTNQTVTNATAPPTAAPVVSSFSLTFKINENFNENLANSSSPEFKERAQTIKSQLEPFFRKLFLNFLRMLIKGFRRGSIIVDSELEFGNGSTPNASAVTSTFNAAINSSNFTFSIDPTSIVLTLLTGNSTTNSSTNNTTTSANVTTTTVSGTNTTQTVTNATASTTAAPAVSSFNLTFKINDNFTENLANSSSTEFQTRAQNIRSQLEPFFRKAFLNFLRMLIKAFRRGSVIVESELAFGNGSTPNVSDVKNALVLAINSSNLTFSIDPNSIIVTLLTGNSTTGSMSPALASSLPLLWVSLASLLLSAVLHF